MAGLLDFLQSASNAAASNVTAPVDGIAWLLRKAGLDVGEPMGGSDWAKRQGLMRDVPQSVASLGGETLGLLGPMVAAAKAPQIARGLLQGAENLAVPAKLNPQLGATVWHGSPHKFDQFDSTKIGTGEGAQAYGHGLYLAEAPDVARTYSADRAYVGAAMQGKPLAINYDDPAWLAQKTIDELGGPAKAVAHLQMVSRTAAKNMTPESAAAVRGAIDLVSSGAVTTKGNIYKVDLPDEHIAKMLDWDKPLSQQAHKVQQAAAKLGITDAKNGEDLLWQLKRQKFDSRQSMPSAPDKAPHVYAADSLREQGIPGIRYLDGGSRAGGAGTSNYVIFPQGESLLTILERNGIPVR